MDARFTQHHGTNVYTGNELIVKGALESGVGLLAGYPGSPVADVFEVAGRLRKLLEEKGISCQVANNEALTAARMNGSQMAPVRALGFMKSVGGHVAADGLAISNLAGVHPQGGAVVLIGDDPWTDSTQVPADSRFLFEHLRIPCIEPGTFQELKDWINPCFTLSTASNLYVGYLVTTNQADGGSNVEVGPNAYPVLNERDRTVLETATISPDDRVMLAPDTARAEIELVEDRFPRVFKHARELGFDQVLHVARGKRRPGRQRLGIITSGMAYNYVEHALSELGISGRIPILKLGLIYPVDPGIVEEFAQHVDEIVVVEERRDFIERQVLRILYESYQAGRFRREVPLWGKQFPYQFPGIPSTRGLNPSLVIRHLAPLLLTADDPAWELDHHHIEAEIARIDEVTHTKTRLPARTPTFCPGCPHRDSASVMKDLAVDLSNETYTQIHHNCSSQDLVFHGDIGCYVMLKYKPYQRLMHNLSGMGLGGGTGAGIDPFIDNMHVVLWGFCCFFIRGRGDISDSIKNGQDLTYVILDNKTTAMTGHQPTPAQSVDLLGRPTMSQDIEKIVRSMGRGRWGSASVKVYRVNPGQRERYRRLVEQSVLRPGVKVIVADKECAITAGRRERQQRRKTVAERGFLPRESHININADVCENCLECTKSTGCTGLTFIETDFGRKVATDQSFCVDDGACSKRMACPSFERVEITRRQPPPSRWPWSVDEADGLPPFPELPEVHPLAVKGSYNVFVAGVGGMGVGTVTAILARAAQEAGLDCQLCDKKGLAVRNGGVYSRLVFSADGIRRSPLVPYGKADLVLALDLLEAARGVDPEANLCVAHPSRTTALVNSAETPPVTALMGEQEYDAPRLLDLLRNRTRGDRMWSRDLFAIAECLLGHKQYANLAMLGLAYQRNLLPMGLAHLVEAMRATIPASNWDENYRAFQLGRLLGHDETLPAELRAALEPEQVNPSGLAELVAEKAAILGQRGWGGLLAAEGYRNFVEEAVETMPALEEATLRDLALRLYDLIQYQNERSARRMYLDRVIETYQRDRSEFQYAATKAVIRYLYKTIAIKDEVWVSHLLTSEEKRRRDYQRFQIDPARGDRIRYLHLNRPEFDLFSMKVRFRIKTRPWMLRIMKHLKFLRRLPSWHARERYFRDRYLQLVDRFRYHSRDTYKEFVEVLRCPEEVRGFVEVRYPTMVEPLRRIDALLENPLFRDPPSRPLESQAVHTKHSNHRVRT